MTQSTAVRRSARLSLGGLLVALCLALGLGPARAADGVVGTGTPASCTEAAFDTVFAAVQSSGGGTITFSCGPAPRTILLTVQREVSANTAIRGGGLITLSGGNTTSLFQVFFGKTLTLSEIALARAYGTAGAIENFGTLDVQRSQLVSNTATAAGGAILSYGEVRLTDVTLRDNVAGTLGGALYAAEGSATIVGSQFLSNTLTLNTDNNGGAGVAAGEGTRIVVGQSTFSGNRTTATFAEGGGIRSAGTLTVTASLFTLNNASRGGGISVVGGSANVTGSVFRGNLAAYGAGLHQSAGALTVADASFTGNGYGSNGVRVTTGGGGLSWFGGTASLTNVTISGNWASYGGGFDHANGTTSLTNVTLSGNAAVGGAGLDQGGGAITLTNVTVGNNTAQFFAAGVASRGGTIALRNTLLAGNLKTDGGQPFNCNKALAPSSFSLSSDFTCGLGAGRDGVAVGLGPLADNGGGLLTHLPRRGSPAIDAGTGALCPASDARGVTRPQGQACDVGAVEVRPDDLLIRLFLPNLRR